MNSIDWGLQWNGLVDMHVQTFLTLFCKFYCLSIIPLQVHSSDLDYNWLTNWSNNNWALYIYPDQSRPLLKPIMSLFTIKTT